MPTHLIESMQYVDALEELDENLGENPKNAISLLYKGRVLIALYQYDEAIEVFDLIEEIAPTYTDAGTEKGYLMAWMKEVGLPTRHNEPIGKNPEYSTKALIYEGLANFYRQHYEEAIYCYDMALRIVPNNIYALFYRGDAFTKLKKHEEAIASYDKALHVDVTNLKDLIFKGVEFEKLKRYEEAITCYRKAEPLFPDKNRNEIHMLIGNVLIKAKKFDDAIAVFDKILAKEPNDGHARDGKMRAEYGKAVGKGGAVPYYR